MSSRANQVEAILDGLSSPTAKQVATATRYFDASDVAAAAAAEALAGGVGGGSSPSTLTATVTTDPNLFYVEHVFDLGHATTAYVRFEVLAITPDGETFGTGSDELTADLSVIHDAVLPDAGISRDGVTYYDAVPEAMHVVPVAEVGDVLEQMIPVPRYLSLVVWLQENFNLYAGANNPTVQVRLDVEYV